jgi:hypothetical protein
VVCRQLGYKYALGTLEYEEVPDDPVPVWLDKVACSGSEQNLTSCPHSGWRDRSCRNGKNAGVKCTSIGKVTVSYQFHNCESPSSSCASGTSRLHWVLHTNSLTDSAARHLYVLQAS